MAKSNKSRITAQFKVDVPHDFAVETAVYIERRIDRIKKDLRNRGMIASMIIVQTVDIPEGK